MPKLTETQLVILTAAAGRNDGAALPIPKSLDLRSAALTKTLDGLRKKGLLEEKPTPRDAIAWCEGKDGRRMMLIITEAGLRALNDGPTKDARKPSTRIKTPAKTSRKRRKAVVGKPKGKAAAKPSANTAVRPGTKQALLIDLLKRKTGTTIDDAVEATGWQAHSVRGVISGTLKKKLGLDVTSEKVERRGRVYQIAGRG